MVAKGGIPDSGYGAKKDFQGLSAGDASFSCGASASDESCLGDWESLGLASTIAGVKCVVVGATLCLLSELGTPAFEFLECRAVETTLPLERDVAPAGAGWSKWPRAWFWERLLAGPALPFPAAFSWLLIRPPPELSWGGGPSIATADVGC